jgi:hypothetical protein
MSKGSISKKEIPTPEKGISKMRKKISNMVFYKYMRTKCPKNIRT